MGIDMSVLGLLIIAIAWLIQLLFIWNGKKEMQRPFAFVYCIGVIILIVDGFMQGFANLAIANIVCLIMAVLVLIRLSKS